MALFSDNTCFAFWGSSESRGFERRRGVITYQLLWMDGEEDMWGLV